MENACELRLKHFHLRLVYEKGSEMSLSLSFQKVTQEMGLRYLDIKNLENVASGSHISASLNNTSDLPKKMTP